MAVHRIAPHTPTISHISRHGYLTSYTTLATSTNTGAVVFATVWHFTPYIPQTDYSATYTFLANPTNRDCS